MEVRDILTGNIFVPGPDDPGLGALEHAFSSIRAAAPARAKLEKARRDGKLTKDTPTAIASAALGKRILTDEEHALIIEADRLRNNVIQVSDFDPVSYSALR